MNGCPLHGDVWCTCPGNPPKKQEKKRMDRIFKLLEDGRAKWCLICDEKFDGPTTTFCGPCGLTLSSSSDRVLIVKLAERIRALEDEAGQ